MEPGISDGMVLISTSIHDWPFLDSTRDIRPITMLDAPKKVEEK